MGRTLRNLVLIRARHLAETMTTPTFLVDAAGDMIFYNEAAEGVLGRTFADEGTIPQAEVQKRLNVRDRDGNALPLEAMAGWSALQKRRPGYGQILFADFSGNDHLISVCALPLFTHPDDFEGSLVIFWEDD